MKEEALTLWSGGMLVQQTTTPWNGFEVSTSSSWSRSIVPMHEIHATRMSSCVSSSIPSISKIKTDKTENTKASTLCHCYLGRTIAQVGSAKNQWEYYSSVGLRDYGYQNKYKDPELKTVDVDPCLGTVEYTPEAEKLYGVRISRYHMYAIKAPRFNIYWSTDTYGVSLKKWRQRALSR